MAGSWNANIIVNVFLAGLAVGTGDLKALLIVAKASNSLNSATVVTYSSLADATTANTAGYISNGTLAAVTAWFGQTPHGTSIKIANWDLVATETAAACLTRIQAVDNDWYYVLTDQRGDTNLLAMATAVNALGSAADTGIKRFVGQSASAFNTGTYPSALTTLQAMTRVAIVYHETTTVWNDVAWVSKVSAFSQADFSPGWMWISLDGITAPTLTSSGITNLKTNNANGGSAAGGFALVMGQGVGTDGTPLKSSITADILAMTARSRVTTLLINSANRGKPVTVSLQGQQVVLGALTGVLQEMVEAGHFVPGQVVITAETISTTDYSLKQLRFTILAQLNEQVITITMNAYCSATPVVVAAA